jgi:hypothetical protein
MYSVSSKHHTVGGSRNNREICLKFSGLEAKSITRQQCRVWIETEISEAMEGHRKASPGSNAGCGLKQHRKVY